MNLILMVFAKTLPFFLQKRLRKNAFYKWAQTMQGNQNQNQDSFFSVHNF